MSNNNSEIKNAIEFYIKSPPVEMDFLVYLFIKYLGWVPELTNSTYKYGKC